MAFPPPSKKEKMLQAERDSNWKIHPNSSLDSDLPLWLEFRLSRTLNILWPQNWSWSNLGFLFSKKDDEEMLLRSFETRNEGGEEKELLNSVEKSFAIPRGNSFFFFFISHEPADEARLEKAFKLEKSRLASADDKQTNRKWPNLSKESIRKCGKNVPFLYQGQRNVKRQFCRI